MWTTAALVLAGAGAARAATTITIDASKQTTGNPHFWSNSVGTGTATLTLRSDLESHYKIGNREAGFQRVRGHGVLSDAMGIYKGPGQYSWTNFDKYLTAIQQAGMRPIMEMDFMPTALAANGSDKDTFKNATDYKNFIAAVAQHCVDKFGMDDVSKWYWEIWNEPDYSGFWNGTMSAYYTLYDNAVAAITSVIPNALVGGPATTQEGPIGAFLQHCKSAGTRVTFASSHKYPGGSNTGTTADANNFVSENNNRVNAITSAGYKTSDVLSFNTEWNSSYSGQGGTSNGDAVVSMDNHWNVGFILKAAKLLSDKDSGDTPPLTVFSYWVLSDVFDESGGPSGSYILGQHNGQLPFGQVFGLMTFQGIRKAAFNAFKMLNYTGPKRLMSSGGTSSDGVDAMATMSDAGDEIQILAYDQAAKLNSTGTDMVTIKVNNIPTSLAGKKVFVTQFIVDETHSNPYSVWVSQGKPATPTEAQLQALRAAQHLALAQPVTTMTLDTSYMTSFTMNRQSGTLLLLSVNRPVTGRNALVTMEGEDYDGQSGATKEDSNDTDLGQSISVTAGGSIFYDMVDLSDAGVNGVKLRVQAASATSIEFHADSATGTLMGKCDIAATGTTWATQSCTLTPTTGVKDAVYLVFAGAARLNWLQFQGVAGNTTGTGGTTGTSGAGGSSSSGAGGNIVTGAGGSGNTTSGAGGSGNTTSGAGGSGNTTSGAGGSGNTTSGAGGSGNTTSGAGGSSTTGTGGDTTSGAGGSPVTGGGKSGCSCAVATQPGSVTLVPLLGLAALLGVRRRRRGA
ncbi:MAG TPA: carbohydrate-binding protein [Polyangia bacterium]|nr:carbohydrate-binding protein [Polyangia bacterium]